jgi:AmiR/NasT family two-component response regulator
MRRVVAGGEMTRVLVGDFAALERLGYQDILRVANGVHLVEATEGDLVQRVVDALPDVVVLDSDAADSDELVEQIVHRFPRVLVIACSSTRPVMRVFPPLHYGESYTTRLEPALLTSAVQA